MFKLIGKYILIGISSNKQENTYKEVKIELHVNLYIYIINYQTRQSQ